MKLIGYAALVVALAAFGIIPAQASAPASSPTAASALTVANASPLACTSATGRGPLSDCFDDCNAFCFALYPENPSMYNLCRFSCFDQQCGGGPIPFE